MLVKIMKYTYLLKQILCQLLYGRLAIIKYSKNLIELKLKYIIFYIAAYSSLKPRHNFFLKTLETVASFTNHKAKRSDSGIYRLQLKNREGSGSISLKVTVLGKINSRIFKLN